TVVWAALLPVVRALRGSDAQGAALLEAYLDRVTPDWRERDSGEAPGAAPRTQSSGQITRGGGHEAVALEHGASEYEIRAAHRRLMKKVHPDQGGSDYLAARINEAKDGLHVTWGGSLVSVTG